jgi:hypothetical protein
MRDKRLSELSQISGDFGIMWIAIQSARIPAPRFLNVASLSRDITQMSQHDHVFGIESKGELKHFACFLDSMRIVKRLPVHHVAAHVGRLLREVRPADGYCLLGITGLAVFVGERGKISPRILVKFLPQLVDPR